MKIAAFGGIAAVVACLSLVASPAAATDPRAVFAQRPLAFERVEQTDGVRFSARGHGYALELAQKGATLALQDGGRRSVVTMSFRGASARPAVREEGELPGRLNYIHGNDPDLWRCAIPSWKRVRLSGLYPGVDAVFYGNQSRLEYDLVLQPGADPSLIGVTFSGAKSTRLDRAGNLVVDTGSGTLRFDRPVAYQDFESGRRPVDAGYVRIGRHAVGFRIGSYDRGAPLVIDPMLVYSTFFGGVGDDYVYDVALDASGNAYIAGGTDGSPFLATAGSYDTSHASGPATGYVDRATERAREAFVSKIAADGSSVLWTTFLGGESIDAAFGIRVDGSGVVIVGETRSSDFPTTGGAVIPSLPHGFGDAVTSRPHGFVTKLNTAGSALLFSTYLGGDSNYSGDRACAVAIDTSGNIYVTGETSSTDFPVTPSAYQPAINDTTRLTRQDAFVTKLTSAGAIVWSTFLGSPGTDRGDSIAVDSSGNVIVRVRSDGAFPTTETNRISATGNYYVVKLASSGSSVLWSTGLGATGTARAMNFEENEGRGLAVDSSGAVYVTGWEANGLVTTPASFQPVYPGCRSAFVVKINSGGSQAYGTYVNGPAGTCRESFGRAVAVDSSGRAWMTGFTENPNYPTANPIQPNHARTLVGYAGSDDVVVTALGATGSSLYFSTFLGGNGNDWGSAIAVASGVVTVAGILEGASGMGSVDFWSRKPVQPYCGITYNSGDVFVAKLDVAVATPAHAITSVLPQLFRANDVLVGGSIRGFGFQDGATITVGGKPTYTTPLFRNSSYILFTAPNNMAPGTYTLTLTNPDLTTASAQIVFADLPRLEVTSSTTQPFAPMEGPVTGGTTVTIRGYNYDSGAKVAFGDQPAASVTWINANEIHAVSPPHLPGCVAIIITNSDGAFAGDADRCDFRYLPLLPTVTGVAPSSIRAGGQYLATVTGSNFFGTSVRFGFNAATNFTVIDPGTETVLTPILTAGTYDVEVRNLESTTAPTLPKAFTVVGLPSIDPIWGPRSGGTVVTIRGNAFAEGAQVFFGSIEAASVTFVAATTLQATTPPGSPGKATVYVRNPSGLTMAFQDFAFVTEGDVLALTGATPSTGPTTGGTQVTITGSGFASSYNLHAWFGGLPATSISKLTETTIKVTAPPHEEGTVDIAVMNQDTNAAAASLPAAFTYTLPPPTVSSVTPGRGVPEGGTAVTVSGANFSSGATVTFGGEALANPGFVNSATITGTTPAHAAGSVDVMVTNPGGQSGTKAGAFTYAYPSIMLAPATASLLTGAKKTFTVTIDSAQTTSTDVALSSSGAAATVPASVAIGAHATSATFDVSGAASGSATITAKLPQALGGGTATATVSVTSLPPGDVNGDSTVDASDIVYLVNYLFGGGDAPAGPADLDGDGTVGVLDLFYLVNLIFAGGPPPNGG